MTCKFEVGDECFFMQGRDVVDVGIVVEIKEANSSRDFYIVARMQQLGTTHRYREDHIKTREEVYNV